MTLDEEHTLLTVKTLKLYFYSNEGHYFVTFEGWSVPFEGSKLDAEKHLCVSRMLKLCFYHP